MTRRFLQTLSTLGLLATISFAQTIVNGVGVPTNFMPERHFSAGEEPNNVTLGDVNGDGLVDMVIISADGGSDKDIGLITVRLGDGLGGFPDTMTFDAGKKSLSIALGDFDGNGTLDAVVGRDDGDTISIYSNDGSGAYSPMSTLTSGSKPRAVATADLNGDSNPDIIAVNKDDESVTIFLCDGMGGFTSSIRPVSSRPIAIVLADLNGDGFTDIATANEGDDNVSVLVNDGFGSFVSKSDFDAGSKPTAITTADLNADGNLDLIVTNKDSDDISVLMNIGGGTFAPATSTPAGNEPQAVASTDFNFDGYPDLAVTSKRTNEVLLYLNDTTGNLILIKGRPVGDEPVGIILADTNNDGRNDIIVAIRGTNEVVVIPAVPFVAPTDVVLVSPRPVYELGQIAELTVVTAPGNLVWVLFDLALGSTFVPPVGTLDLAVSADTLIVSLGSAAFTGGMVTCDGIPCDPSLDGVSIYAQAVVRDLNTGNFAISPVEELEIFGGDCTDECDGGIVELGLETHIGAGSGPQNLTIMAAKNEASGESHGMFEVTIDPANLPALPVSNADGTITIEQIEVIGNSMRLRFTVDAGAGSQTKFGSNTFFSVTFGGSSINRVIHTSCSQPLPVGSHFGDFIVTRLVDAD